jgi:spore germination protein YaaH
MWVPTWVDWPKSLSTVTSSNPKVATMVSPDFYDFNKNGNYKSGPPVLDYTSSNPTIAQVAAQVHAAGMLLVPLVYGGASNLTDGTDQGILNVLADQTTQANFMTAMVSEAQTRQYDGWNLDFEVGPTTTYSKYGAQYISFLTAFKNALHARKMVLTVDVGQWYIRQCGGDALVDLTQIGQAVDYVIIEDYVTDFGNPVASCPGPAKMSCSTFGDLLNLMCYVTPSSAVSIGIEAQPGGSVFTNGANEGTGPILAKALSAISAVGFKAVAVWPDGSPFLDSTGVPNGQTYISLVGQWLNH